VVTMLGEGQYDYFKNQLLDIHQLSDYEKFDMLFKMEPMGGRKPSQLLHAMLLYYPPGMERQLSFHYFQPGDPRALAARADRLSSVHSSKAGTFGVANVQGGDLIRQHCCGLRQ
jgi:hypothetical protein